MEVYGVNNEIEAEEEQVVDAANPQEKVQNEKEKRESEKLKDQKINE